MALLTASQKSDLARRIALLETDCSAMTMGEEIDRLAALQRLWEEYGDRDEAVRLKIERVRAQRKQERW